MEIVSEGSLESISRPSSTSSEKKSNRTKQIKHPNKLLPSASGSFEVLPPEGQGYTSLAFESPDHIISLVEEDIAVEDIPEDSDSDELDSSDSYCKDNETPRTEYNEELTQVSTLHESSEDFNNQKKSEKPGYQLTQQTGSSDAEEADNNEEELDPKIKMGLEKIRKLDQILADKTKKEKEVKVYRRQLEKIWQESLKQLAAERELSGQGKPLELGPAHLLALGPTDGSSDDAGVDDSRTVTPVFATQPLGNEENRYIASSQGDSSPSSKSSSSVYDDSDTRNTPSEKKGSGKRTRRDRKPTEKKEKKTNADKKGKQDFIRRNIKLAADAGNIIPMTEDEKKRIEELMSEDTDHLMLDTPFTDTLSLVPGTGYQPDENELKALADIDMKLQFLLPPDELDLLSNREVISSLSQESTRTLSTLHGDEEAESENIDIGEQVLKEEKQMRDMKQRLLAIEDELKKFNSVPEGDPEVPLSDELLAKLLAGSRTTSRNTSISETVWSSLSTPTPICENVQTPAMHENLFSNGGQTTSRQSEVK